MSSLLQEELPPLVELPVYRDTYCSQEMTDDLLQHLWLHKKDLILELCYQEKRGVPEGRDALYGKRYGDVIDYFRQDAAKDLMVPDTRLGMLDLLYELSCRIRSALSLQDVAVIGKPLISEEDYESFPELISIPLEQSKKASDYGITQSLVDEVLSKSYAKDPVVFYEYSEQMRRLMKSYEISQAFQWNIKSCFPQGRKDPWSVVMGAAVARLHIMCEIPSFDQLMKRFE